MLYSASDLAWESARAPARSVRRPPRMPVILTIVRSCRWPRLRLEFFRRRFLKAMTFGPRVCSTISPTTLAPATCGAPTRLVSPSNSASTSSNTTCEPASPGSAMTVIFLSAATVYCLPPVLMTANIVFPVFRPARCSGLTRGRLLCSGPESRLGRAAGECPALTLRTRDARKTKSAAGAALERARL